MDGTERRPLSDSQLDREIESALGVEPSPEFLARVRTRIAAEPGPSAWRLAVRGRGVQPLVAWAVVAVIVAIVIPQWMRDDDIRPRPATTMVARNVSRPTAEPARKASAVDPDLRTSPSRGVRRRAVSVNELPLRLSQPLFSEEDRRVFLQLVGAVEDGRLPPVVEAATAAGDQPAAPSEMRIEPLVIDPLPLLAGVRREGEGQW